MDACECGQLRDGVVGCKRCDFLDGFGTAKGSGTGGIISAMRAIGDAATLESIAAEAGVTVRNVYKWLGELLEAGRVEKLPGTGTGQDGEYHEPGLWRLIVTKPWHAALPPRGTPVDLLQKWLDKAVENAPKDIPGIAGRLEEILSTPRIVDYLPEQDRIELQALIVRLKEVTDGSKGSPRKKTGTEQPTPAAKARKRRSRRS